MALFVDIEKSFGQGAFVLRVQFQAKDGVTALLGASGCGKSMTLKCIAGVEKPDRGRILLDGQTLFDSERHINLSPQKRHVGYLFQNYALFPNMTVAQNIGIPLHGKLPNADRLKAVQEMIARFYLDGLAGSYPAQLSGGQQQRCALARILIAKPRILMLDEPFSALDSYLRWQLEQEVRHVLEGFSGTTLFVSHNRDEVYRLCEEIIVMDHGHVDIHGEKWGLFHNPQTYACCLLTGCKNISPARRLSEDTVYAEDWGLSLHTGVPVPEDLRYVGIRAHQFHPCAGPQANAFPFTVRQVTQDTFSYILMLQPTAEPGAKLLRWELDKKLFAKIGQAPPPYLSIAPEDLLLLR